MEMFLKENDDPEKNQLINCYNHQQHQRLELTIQQVNALTIKSMEFEFQIQELMNYMKNISSIIAFNNYKYSQGDQSQTNTNENDLNNSEIHEKKFVFYKKKKIFKKNI
eukprot:GHVR01089545.1.p1 GENE.GHVR01089545.1~~GHVR01089545.1.p1  ORF type:complete len:109 (-),score=13.99 GHVR01089545.1:1186-1512(-)